MYEPVASIDSHAPRDGISPYNSRGEGEDDNNLNDADFGEDVIGFYDPVPISKPPSLFRDGYYALAFLLHFFVISIFSIMEQQNMNKSTLVLYEQRGELTSTLMIIASLGALAGILLVLVLNKESVREKVLMAASPTSILAKVCFGNILLIFQSRYSFIAVFFYLSAAEDAFRYRHIMRGISFMSALIQIVNNIFRKYGSTLLIAISAIITCQTLVLFYWMTLFIAVLSNVSSAYVGLFVLPMCLSWLWIVGTFQAIIAYTVGGCVLWYFVRDREVEVVGVESHSRDDLKPDKRVILHIQCAMTMAFGSVCKSGLVCDLCHRFLEIRHWYLDTTTEGQGNNCRSTIKHLLGECIRPHLTFIRMYSRLSIGMSATYGRTLRRSGFDLNKMYPKAVELSLDSSLGSVLTALIVTMASVLSYSFGLATKSHQSPSSAVMFLLLAFLLAYAGVSSVMHIYRSAIDSLFLAFYIKPEAFATDNEIVYLGLLRNSENVLMDEGLDDRSTHTFEF